MTQNSDQFAVIQLPNKQHYLFDNTSKRVIIEFAISLNMFIEMNREALEDYVCNFITDTSSLEDIEFSIMPSLRTTHINLRASASIGDSGEWQLITDNDEVEFQVTINEIASYTRDVNVAATNLELAQRKAIDRAYLNEEQRGGQTPRDKYFFCS